MTHGDVVVYIWPHIFQAKHIRLHPEAARFCGAPRIRVSNVQLQNLVGVCCSFFWLACSLPVPTATTVRRKGACILSLLPDGDVLSSQNKVRMQAGCELEPMHLDLMI